MIAIGGLQRFSLVDYPGRIGAIVFTRGCNFRCPYCHNPELVDPDRYTPLIDADEVLRFLQKRRGKLEAVTISGGEPTLQPDLVPFIREIRQLGYLVKLDTNGSKPGVLEGLIRQRGVDYIALDVKAPLEHYGRVVQAGVDTAAIRRSIEMVSTSGIPYEFRTTIARSLLAPHELRSIARLLERGRYALQRHVPAKCLDPAFLDEPSYSASEFALIGRSLATERLQVILR